MDAVVIGGGVGGTALGLVLAQTPGLRFLVCERDESFGERRQGYGLTLQHHDAMRVLGGAALEQQIREEDTVNDAHFIFAPDGALASVFGRFMDPVTTKKAVPPKAGRYNVHLPRQRLRELLVERLERVEGAPLQWGWRLERFEEQEEAVVVWLSSRDGKSRVVRTRVLVGADGIHSGVRSGIMASLQRVDSLQYLGMLVVLGMSPSRDALCLRTTFQTLDGTTRLFTMPFTAAPREEDSTFWQLSFPCDEAEANRLRGDLPALREELWRRCSSWHDPVPALLRDAPPDMITATPVYDRGEAYPFLRTAPAPLSRVTLIGDAAHPMSPFKGQGANQALLDAVLLGQALGRLLGVGANPNRAQVLQAMRGAESKMYDRSEKKVRDSRAVAVRLHSSEAAQDPETRGISAPLVQLFKEEGLGARTHELRQRVLECLKRTKQM